MKIEENIFIDFFNDREIYRRSDYPEIYRNMKSPKVDMTKMFKEFFEFREFPGYRKSMIH